MSQLAKLKHSRGCIKAFLTRTGKSIRENTSASEAKIKLEKLNDSWKEFNNIQHLIEDLEPTSEDEAKLFREECERECVAFENNYFEITAKLQIIVDEAVEQQQFRLQRQFNQSSESYEIQPTVQASRKFPKLPEIKLPEFSGDYTKWLFFKDCFESTIHNDPHLSNTQKHQYLVGVLHGEARKVIEGFSMSNENYVSAWNLLKSTYDNPVMIIETHLEELFNFPGMAKDSKSDSLRKLNWHIQTNISSLKSLNQPVEHWDTLIIHLAKRKLDYAEQRNWQESTKNRTAADMPTLTEFTTFLAERSHSLMLLPQQKVRQEHQKLPTQINKNSNKKVVMAAKVSSCSLCGENHLIFQCDELLKRSPDDRKTLLVQKKHCINCLKFGHVSKFCRGSTCKKCHLKHNTLLHKEDDTSETADNATASVVNHCVQSDSSGPSSVFLAGKPTSQVLLSTAQVYVKDIWGKKITCRALLDAGSQSNLITERLSKSLGQKYINQNTQIIGVDNTQVKSRKATRVSLSSMHHEFEAEVECLVLPSITERLPQSRINTKEIVIPRDIILADPTFNEPGDIDLLIGAGLYWKIIMGQPKNHYEGQPVLQNTRLGWILGGEISNCQGQATSCFTVTNGKLSEQLERFWKQESISETRHYTKEEQSCEEQFSDTTTRDSDGRFIVRLPVRPEVALGESREQAKRRFEALERRFNRQPELKQAYCDFMEEYEQLGHMSRITDNLDYKAQEIYYIPHQAVLRPESSSTKLRVVFDASAKTTLGTSLNTKLMAGPNLQGDLFHIILRFRMHKFIVTADVEKMFRQILIHPDDRSLQQILWRKDVQTCISTYQLNTVTYGTASAPYHAMRCLRELANLHENTHPIAATVIRRDFYMDDCITGGDTLSIVKQIQQELLEVLKKGGMLLRKWRSNNSQILENLNVQQDIPYLMILDKEETCKTLGLVWDSGSDVLQYRVNLPKQSVKTKREVLSKISQIFDPLGLVGPVLIKGKLIMQQLWTDGLDWDHPLTVSHYAAWNDYYASLPNLNQLRIPRNVNPDNCESKFHLHGFSDASEKAFGACIYAVSKNQDGIISSHLICAKSKVAPLKTISLPRLELEAALLLTKLAREARNAFGHKMEKICLWSDSTIVLGWICTEPRLLKTFVANRVTKIQEASDDVKWSHVPSEDNPADILSRGTSSEQIQENQLWWYGPNWLTHAQPLPTRVCKPETVLPEMKSTAVVLVTTFTSRILHKFSSFSKLCRVIAYCHRFVNNARNRAHAKTGHIEPAEFQQAEKTVIRWTQIESLSSSHQCLVNNENLPRGSPLKSLNPFLDQDGLIRVGGRLRFSELTEEQKHPVILPAKHHITTIIIRGEHERLRHCPPEQLLHSIRQRYWPVSGRRETQAVVHKCLKCFKFNPSVPEVRMGDLPKERVAQVSRPFVTAGVDYAGPFEIRESKRRGRLHISKGYIAVFTCFSTKAVHLELVSDLTTEAFLAALQRFTARRGNCSQMFSDNGRTFVGAANTLKELQSFLSTESPNIASALAGQHVTWKFIPPRAPHFGGLWEAAVKIMKRHVYTESQGRIFTFEEMCTLLCDIEAILNSRPLTPLTRDPNDLSILTPAHFLIGGSLVQPVQSNCNQEPDNRLTRWQHLQKLRQVIWRRWQREYLQELQKRTKWRTSGQRVDVGSLVLLIEDGVPPLKWPRGRVIQVHPGKDDEIRVVTLRTCTGTFTRSVKKLCPLPLEDPSEV